MTRLAIKALAAVMLLAPLAQAADVRSQNFTVSAASQELAQRIASDAEKHRKATAIRLTGRELPRWPSPCAIKAVEGTQSSGVTTFGSPQAFTTGMAMTVRGSREEILRNVLPHEVGHAVLHTYCPRELPRWVDEGFCVTLESAKHRQEQIGYLNQSRRGGHAYSLSQLVGMYEYPGQGKDGNKVMALYSQAHGFVSYLVAVGGYPRFLTFVRQGCEGERRSGRGSLAAWDAALTANYGCGAACLQRKFETWAVAGGLAKICRCEGDDGGQIPAIPGTLPTEGIPSTQPLPDDGGQPTVIQLPSGGREIDLGIDIERGGATQQPIVIQERPPRERINLGIRIRDSERGRVGLLPLLFGRCVRRDREVELQFNQDGSGWRGSIYQNPYRYPSRCAPLIIPYRRTAYAPIGGVVSVAPSGGCKT